jgi:dTDP-4-amino-4,6-dideoxygalactose transaminase
MLLADDEEITAAHEELVRPRFRARRPRLNSRMSNVLAAIAARQLERLEATVEHRRALAARYRDELSDLARARPVATEATDGRRSSCYRFALVTDGLAFDEVERGFRDHGVIVRRPVKQLCHRALGLDPDAFPQAEAHFDRIVSLPLYPDLAEREQETVLAAARSVLG